jgi:hypothetical protein
MVEADARYEGPYPVRTPNDFYGNLEWKRSKGVMRERHDASMLSSSNFRY